MLLYPLLLGVFSLISPWFSLILLLGYSGKIIAQGRPRQLQSLLLFMLAPLLAMLVYPGQPTRLLALDALLGVGVTLMVFILALRRNHVLSDALMVAFLFLAGYGMLRFALFGELQTSLFDQAVAAFETQFPLKLENDLLLQMQTMGRAVLPAVWIVSQGFALVIGFLLFLRALKVSTVLEQLRFPSLYNMLIVAILPLFVLEQTKLIFLNALISLCFIPLIQGAVIFWQKLGLIFNNRIVAGILMLLILIYANILLVLYGFADIWLNKNNYNPGGTTA